jgi:hypothetical protein
MTEYSWDNQILLEIKSESKSKLEQSWYYNRIVTTAESVFFLVQIPRDLSNLKDHIKKEQI